MRLKNKLTISNSLLSVWEFKKEIDEYINECIIIIQSKIRCLLERKNYLNLKKGILFLQNLYHNKVLINLRKNAGKIILKWLLNLKEKKIDKIILKLSKKNKNIYEIKRRFREIIIKQSNECKEKIKIYFERYNDLFECPITHDLPPLDRLIFCQVDHRFYDEEALLKYMNLSGGLYAESPFNKRPIYSSDLIKWENYSDRCKLRKNLKYVNNISNLYNFGETYFDNIGVGHIIFSFESLILNKSLEKNVEFYSPIALENRYSGSIYLEIYEENWIGLFWYNKYCEHSRYLTYPIPGIEFEINGYKEIAHNICDQLDNLKANVYSIDNKLLLTVDNILMYDEQTILYYDSSGNENTILINEEGVPYDFEHPEYYRIEYLSDEREVSYKGIGWYNFIPIEDASGPDGRVHLKYKLVDV